MMIQSNIFLIFCTPEGGDCCPLSLEEQDILMRDDLDCYEYISSPFREDLTSDEYEKFLYDLPF